MNKEKILYLVNHLSLHGGIEKIVTDKINAWIEMYNFDVILVTKNQISENFIYKINPKTKHIDLQIKNKTGKFYFISNLMNYIRFYWKVSQILTKHNPKVLFSTLTSIDALLVPFLPTKTKKIVEFHHPGMFLSKNWSIKKWIYKHYHKAIVLNNDEVKYYKLKNISVIQNFINIETKKNENNENIILAAGRIDEIKQYDHLIDVWSKIRENHKNWSVYLYGNGNNELQKKLRQKIDELNLGDNFHLCAAIENNKLLKLMSKSKIYTVTSYSECFPMIILEAMSKGMVVVSYDCPNGPRNIINNNIDGILIPSGDKILFAETLDKLISDENKQKYLRANALVNVKNFGKNNIMNKWFDLVNNL